MKTDQKKFYALLIFAASVLWTSCNKEEIPSGGSVQGHVYLYNEDNPGIQTPLEGKKVYLLDAAVAMLTIEGGNGDGPNPFLDSVYTDENGLYRFENLDPFYYAVMPEESDRGYRFDPANGTVESILFTVTEAKESFNIDFKAQEPVPENTEGKFKLHFKSVNYPSGDYLFISVTQFETGIELDRLYNPYPWSRKFIESEYKSTDLTDLEEFTLEFDYGYYGLHTLTNTFDVTLYWNGELLLYKPEAIDFSISDCPAESTWTIDWTNKTITRSNG